MKIVLWSQFYFFVVHDFTKRSLAPEFLSVALERFILVPV